MVRPLLLYQNLRGKQDPDRHAEHLARTGRDTFSPKSKKTPGSWKKRQPAMPQVHSLCSRSPLSIYKTAAGLSMPKTEDCWFAAD